MRRLSRTHRVALDWLFDRINLEQQIQIKYGDTKNQLADILTKGSFSRDEKSFTRDEWNHLLRLFNMMRFSMFSCSHFSNFLSDPIGEQSAMSKGGQEATQRRFTDGVLLRSPPSARENPPQDLGYPVNPETCTDHPKLRSRTFSSEATGKCSKLRFLETGRPGGIFELC